MKKLFILVPFLMFLLASQAQFQPHPAGSQYCSQKKSSMTHQPILDIPESGPSHSYNVLSYTLNVDLYHCYSSPYPKDFKATNIIKFRVDSVLNYIKLNAVNSSLTIDSVRLNGSSFTHTGNILTVQLNRTYNVGEIAQVKVCYHHKNVTDYAFYASNGMVFTDCEPEGARNWFPCWDKPSDKATLDLTAKVPYTVKFGSNGKLMDSTLVADTCTYHWNSIHPVATYLTVMTSKVNYKLDIRYWHKLSNQSDSIPLRFYYNAGEDPSYIESILPSMTTYYSQNYIEHPFQKNGFAALNNQFPWGGMENQTLTSICPGCWEESLCAHEFAHQWYGDMITCATWADIWLNEGFATWSEAFWQEHQGGFPAYQTDMNNYAATYFQSNAGWAISDSSWANITPNNNILFDYSITYCKGACVLYMVRSTIGDSLFFATMKAYCADTNLKFKNATIGDFNAKVNLITGQNYNWFFNEWIYKPNHPHYINTYSFHLEPGGIWNADFMTQQIQTNAPFFQMPLEIKIHFVDNTDTVVTVMNSYNYSLFQWNFTKQPVSLQFDPNNKIILKEASTVLGIDPRDEQMTGIHLFQNIPNPAPEKTTIVYELDKPMQVKLEIIDILGKSLFRQVDRFQSAGKYSETVDCSSLANGIYYYRLEAGGQSRTMKMIISR